MKKYKTNTTVLATPLTRKEYCDLREWVVPANENPNDAGMLINIVSSFPSNVPGFTGQISWKVKEAFDQEFTEDATSNMSFSEALEKLKEGHKLTRSGWNGKGMFVFLVSGSQFVVSRPPLNTLFPEGTEITYQPHIDLATTTGVVGVWQPSMGDVMATDWEILP